jgi:hypothetical protein
MNPKKKHQTKVLFILKRRDTYWGNDSAVSTLSSGLSNSARLVVEALNKSHQVIAEIVQVNDNNDIDREVHRVRPDVVILEAYWVVPDKFKELTRLHPRVKWVVRNHSEIPFMAQEGITIDWSIRYLQYPNVFVSGNSPRIYEDMIKFIAPVYGHQRAEDRVLFLPNVYTLTHRRLRPLKKRTNVLDICCFGAIRPLKNQLLQAIVAVDYAHEHNKQLRFHINGGRVEGAGSSQILKNLRLFFSHLKDDELIEHPWYPHHQFLEVMEQMDCSMQVSHSETFNIISADAATVGVPIVTSSEVLWSPRFCQANPTSSKSIMNKLDLALDCISPLVSGWLVQNSLNHYSKESLEQWLCVLNSEL